MSAAHITARALAAASLFASRLQRQRARYMAYIADPQALAMEPLPFLGENSISALFLLSV